MSPRPSIPAQPDPGHVIIYRPDAEINAAEDHELRRLLFAAFPFAAVLLTRRYVREPPTHRWLARASSSGDLIGHVAAHIKVISAGAEELRIAGIAEVCVSANHRGQGVARELLAEAHGWIRDAGIPFAMLFGNPKVYSSSGYSVIDNPIRGQHAFINHWNPFKGKPMVRALSKKPWPGGAVDLRGPTF